MALNLEEDNVGAVILALHIKEGNEVNGRPNYGTESG